MEVDTVREVKKRGKSHVRVDAKEPSSHRLWRQKVDVMLCVNESCAENLCVMKIHNKHETARKEEPRRHYQTASTSVRKSSPKHGSVFLSHGYFQPTRGRRRLTTTHFTSCCLFLGFFFLSLLHSRQTAKWDWLRQQRWNKSKAKAESSTSQYSDT